ncbi:uncharacterized protein V3H86_012874 [Mergus octosetaceus]
MENCCLRCRLLYRQCWGMCVGLAIGMVVVVLATALASSREPPGGSEGLEELGTVQKVLQVKVAALGQALAATNRSLAEVLAVTNRSLAETLGQWESCRNELDTLKSTVSELTQCLAQLQRHGDEQKANVGQLQEDNRAIKESLEQQQRQLKEVQKDRNNLWDALSEIQSVQSWRSSGTSVMFPGVAVPLVLLALLFVGTLLL